MSKFYGWYNTKTTEFVKSYQVSNGQRPCVFLTERQAEDRLKIVLYGKPSSYEVRSLNDNVSDEKLY
jgi:hypothetical protein